MQLFEAMGKALCLGRLSSTARKQKCWLWRELIANTHGSGWHLWGQVSGERGRQDYRGRVRFSALLAAVAVRFGAIVAVVMAFLEDSFFVAANLVDLRSVVPWKRFEVAYVGAGELERIEEKSRAFVVNATVENGLHDLLNGDLNGVGVFQKRQFEAGIGFHADRSADAHISASARPRFVVPIAEVGVAQGNGVADLPVGENVIALFHFVSHKRKTAHNGAVCTPLYIPVKI